MKSKSNLDPARRGRNTKDTNQEGRARSKTPRRNLFRREKHSPMLEDKNTVVQSSPTSVAGDLRGTTNYRKNVATCDYDSNPSLLYKLIEYRAWDEVIERTVQMPSEASTWVVRQTLSDPDAADNPSNRWLCWKMLPLHTAILFRAPITVVQAIYNAYPEAIRMADDRNMLPIHIASRIRVESVVMQFLIDAFPTALTMSDYKGRVPLDLIRQDHFKKGADSADSLLKLLENNMALHGINEGIEANNFGAIIADLEVDYDKNPSALIRLIESKSWIEAVDRCERYPQEAALWLCRYEKNGKRKSEELLRWRILPIHSAVVLNAPKSVIKALVNAYSDGLRMGDDRDMLPIHMAFRLGIDLDVCALLIESYPQSLQHKDNKGNTPMQILKAYRKKYAAAELKGMRIDNPIDIRRKILIDYYLEGRYYRGDSVKNESGMGRYDSDYDSYTAATDSDHDDETYSFYSDDEENNKLFYEGMFKDLVRLTLKGLVNAPKIMCACNSIPLEEPDKSVLR